FQVDDYCLRLGAFPGIDADNCSQSEIFDADDHRAGSFIRASPTSVFQTASTLICVMQRSFSSSWHCQFFNSAQLSHSPSSFRASAIESWWQLVAQAGATNAAAWRSRRR